MSVASAKTNNDERRQERQISKHRESESRWLQKVLFDLSKARHARSMLSSATGEELNPLVTLEDGREVDLDTLSLIIERRVKNLREALGHGNYGVKANPVIRRR